MPPFNSIYAHGFVRAAVCVPRLRPGNPPYNGEHTLTLARCASEAGAAVALFPELGLSAYAIDDLLQQDALLDAVEVALAHLLAASADLLPLILVGAPLRHEQKLFNCAVALHQGHLLGVVPKSFLPNYREFYEKRQFSAAREALGREITLLGQRVPFGNDLLFSATTVPDFVLHAEI